MKVLFQTYAMQIFGVVIGALVLVLVATRLELASVKKDRDDWKSNYTLIINTSKEKETKYKKRMEAYEYARDEIAKYYNEAIGVIDDFRRMDNETECEAANRLFGRAKY